VRVDGRTRSATLKDWRARLKAGHSTLTAVAGGRRRTVLAAEVAPWRLTIGRVGDTVRLTAVKVRLTRAGARFLRRKLALDALPAGALGTLKANATLARGGTTCRPGFAPGEIPAAPAPPARPSTAVDVASATIVWRPRDTFIRYVNTGEGSSVSDGATAGTPQGMGAAYPTPLVYSFGFGLRGGSWYDAASGSAELFARGTVRFRYTDHDIDLTMKDPEILIDGGSSQVTFALASGDCADRVQARATMLGLAPSAPSGHDYGEIPATITTTGASVLFAGFYEPGTRWGSMAVAFVPAS
jgi:hypothetical protein